MIKIAFANAQPIESYDYWSYPFEELDYVLETADDGSKYLYYDGRLYEAPYLDEDDDLIIIQGKPHTEEQKYVRSCTSGDYGPGNPWDAPGMSISDFIK